MALAAVGVAQYGAAGLGHFTLGPVLTFPARFSAVFAGSLVAGAIITRSFVTRSFVTGPIIPGPTAIPPATVLGALAIIARAIIPGPVVPRSVVPRSVVTGPLITGTFVPGAVVALAIIPIAGLPVVAITVPLAAVLAILAGVRSLRLHLLLAALVLEIDVIAGGELVSAQNLGWRTVRLDGAKQAEIVLCVLEVVLAQNPVAGGVRVAGQLLVFFKHVLRVTANLDAVRAVGIEGPVGVLGRLAAPATATPVAPALALHALEISHDLETVRLIFCARRGGLPG